MSDSLYPSDRFRAAPKGSRPTQSWYEDELARLRTEIAEIASDRDSYRAEFLALRDIHNRLRKSNAELREALADVMRNAIVMTSNHHPRSLARQAVEKADKVLANAEKEDV